MLFYWLFFLTLGVLIVIFPNLLAYIVAFFFISIGINLLIMYWMLKPKASKESEFVIGSYKIVKK
jgi:multisubunit Na+/H+ antiporter MnhC subunit